MLRSAGCLTPALQQAVRQAACSAGFASSSQDYSLAIKQAAELSQDVVSAPPGEYGATYGVPMETFERKALIYCPARSAGQSGGGNSMEHAAAPVWRIVFDTNNKWVNPLMGWTSTADPLENVGRTSLLFTSKEEAMAFATKSGWAYEVAEPQPHLLSRPKRFNAYGDNFSTRRKGTPDLSTLPSNRGVGASAGTKATSKAAAK